MIDAGAVRFRANDQCEYCRVPQRAFRERFHVEHIVAKQHGGSSVLENLALACRWCNQTKGPNLAGIDPATGMLVPLFHPRTHSWTEHFHLSVDTDAQVVLVTGYSPIGRATVQVLGMNREIRAVLRYQLWRDGCYVNPEPPQLPS